MSGVVEHRGSCWVLMLGERGQGIAWMLHPLGNDLEVSIALTHKVNGARKRPATSWEKRWKEGRLQRAGIAPGVGK